MGARVSASLAAIGLAWAIASGAAAQSEPPCRPGFHLDASGHCVADRAPSGSWHGGATHSYHHLAALPPGRGGPEVNDLWAARAFLKPGEIPPAGVGAYGVVAFQGLPTPATRERLLMVCKAFEAYLPKQSDIAATVAIGDQMVTVWPIDNPAAIPAADDDCPWVTAHYALQGGLAAIRDAERQGAHLGGQGPFLIGWSPSNTRGRPDKVVLVVDMSHHSSQASLDGDFRYWRDEVIKNPALWRTGFRVQSIRDTVRDFLDANGQYAIDAMGFGGGKK